MRNTIGLIIGLTALCAMPASAQTGFYLPTAPTSYGQDEFRAADGTSCRSSMDGAKRVEVGTYMSGGQTQQYTGYGYSSPGYYALPMQGNAGVYGRFTMSLDARPERIDCGKLFELEMEKRKIEVEIMKRSLVAADHQLDDLKAQRATGPRSMEDLNKGMPSDSESKFSLRLTDGKHTGSAKARPPQKETSVKRRAAPL